MRQQSNQGDKTVSVDDELLGKLYKQAKAQLGDTVKSFWFYNVDLCPACTQRPIGAMKYKGQEALSLNAFLYSERGVLIGYCLCETCAKQILRETQRNPYRQTPIHAKIERNLIAAYHNHLKRLNA